MNRNINSKGIIFLLVIQLVSVSGGQVQINEFLASNVSVNADIFDFDDYSDWIELYNNLDTPVDLSGYYLTDNLNNPLRWKIPDGTVIEPNGYILFWADGYNDYPGTSHYWHFWPFTEHITQRYHTNFKLSSLGEQIGLFEANGDQYISIIASGSEWKYHDLDQFPGDGWFNPIFADSTWKTGQSEFGYGDGDESTVVSFGDDPINKNPTCYFRKSFDVPTPELFQYFTLSMKRDDGAIVYLNGEEIIRENLPDSKIYYETYATEPAIDASEGNWFEWNLSCDRLQQGKNTLAVEVHQYRPTSSDLSFDLEITANNYSEIVLIDSISFKPQYQDVSYGRDPNNNNWYYFGEPTPGQSNTTTACVTADTSTSITFSLECGFYDRAVSLDMYTESIDAEIHYTIDGSKPTERSSVFNQSIDLNSSTIINARAFEPNKLPGIIGTKSYFINENESSLPVVSVTADPFTLWDDQYGIYANNLKQREIPISLTYFEPDGTIGFDVNAGARIGGMNIWRFAQKPLTIYMRSRYGDDIINYHLFENKPVGMFSRIVLRNGGDDWLKAMLRDPMTEALLSGQVMNGFQAYKPCVVYLNDQYWGLQNIREKFDPMYFSTNYNVDPLSYNQLEYSFVSSNLVRLGIVHGDADSYRSILTYMETHDLAVADNYAYVGSLMNMDSFIDFLIIEMYVANTSWRHNREFWQPKGGKWEWLIPDLDRGYNMGNAEANILDEMHRGFPLFTGLLANREFRDRFIQRYAAHIYSTFDPERLVNIVDSLSANIELEMPRHIERWQAEDGIPSMSEWRISIEDIKQFTSMRREYALDNINAEFNLNGTAQLTVDIEQPGSGRILVNGTPMLSTFRIGRFFRNIPLTLTAVPEVGYQFVEWEGLSNNATVDLTLRRDQVLTAIFVHSTGNTIPADITSNTRLTEANSPYSASENIVISENTVLTVDEGVQINLVSGGSIYVHGQLIVNGAEDNPVIFQPNYNSGSERWGAICFVNATDSSLISHAEIRGSTKGNDPINLKAAISAYRSDITIDNCLIWDVEFPIFTQFGKTTLSNSTISTNVVCDFINIKYGEGLVENCVFNGKDAPDTDAIDYDLSIGGVIRNNRIYNFRGFNSDGIDIGEESQDVLITGNLLFNSNDKGISVGQNSSVMIEKNLFIGCNQAIAIKDFSYAYINQNTFYNNNTSVACFEKNFGFGGGSAEVVNSIFSSSIVNSVASDSLSSIVVSYCLSDTDELAGTGNIFDNPMFVYPDIFDLQLQAGSPCIDAGDPSQPLDKDGSVVDIGAGYIYHSDDFPVELHNSLVINEINYHSTAEFDPGDWVEIYNPGDTLVDISNWSFKDSDDAHVFLFPSNLILGAHEYIVICNDSQAFHSLFPDVRNYIGDMNFNLSGGGDMSRLFDNNNNIVDYLSYDDILPWPIDPDGNGPTLELIDPSSDNRLPENWYASKVNFGTPGEQNSALNVPDPTSVPDVFALHQNFPNPFNNTTTIQFDIPIDSKIKIKIYDLSAREIATIHDGNLQTGYYKWHWDSRNVGSGVYFITAETVDWQDAIKVVKIK